MEFEAFRAIWVVEVYGPKLPPRRKIRAEARRRYGSGGFWWQRQIEERRAAEINGPKGWARHGRVHDLETTIARLQEYRAAHPQAEIRIRNTRTDETIPAEALQ